MAATPVASSSVSAGSVVASARQAKPAGKRLGTLVAVVIKARNLPNKQRIGKQDPYCSITVGHQKQKTPAVKRGGQTPHWDAQLQFEIWEESGDKVAIATTETGGIVPTSSSASASASSSLSSKKDEDLLPGQATVGRVKPKNGSSSGDASKRIMKIACYADDPREPELIGETELDFGPTLKKGEFDEWVEIKYKGKYAGEVFIEMTFYSAAPPPVKRKSKPANPGSGYGGPGHFEPLPDTFPQSPDSSSLRPSSHLSPSPAQPLRMSQSQYSLNSSTFNRPPASSPSLDEFGRRKPGQVAFPTPSHTQTSSSGSTDAGYNPPYAPASLAPSASSSHLAKPHRVSFSSYGMTQHDIDSLIRPLSSLSVGGSVNKPLPLPQPSSVQPYRPSPSPAARPVSGQGFAMAPHPSPSPRPLAVAPTPVHHQQPPFQHHHSQQYQHPVDPYADVHPPAHHHRHSMTTYLPDGSDVPWDNNQIPSHAAHQQASHEIGLHNPPPSDQHRPPYVQPGGSWQDPRATSPYPPGSLTPYQEPPSQAYNLASPTHSGSHHPSILQPGSSPQFGQHMSPPPAPHSPLPGHSDAPVWNNAQHFSSPVLADPYGHDAGQSGQFDAYNQSQQPYQDQQTQPPYQPSHEPQYAAYEPQQSSAHYQPAEHNDQYHQHINDHQQQPQQQQYAYDQAAPPAPYDNQQHNAHQQYDQSYAQNNYTQPQGSEQYQQHPAPPVDQYAYQHPAPPVIPQGNYLQQDHRTSSPYRPLPQPTPEPTHSPYQQGSYHSPQPQSEPQPPPPRQPRFGLPVHQPYDPPYIPPSSRQSSHYQPAGTPQPQAQQVPPPIPPVPQELKYDQYHSYGYNSHRY